MMKISYYGVYTIVENDAETVVLSASFPKPDFLWAY
jgi:hypothetical protein